MDTASFRRGVRDGAVCEDIPNDTRTGIADGFFRAENCDEASIRWLSSVPCA